MKKLIKVVFILGILLLVLIVGALLIIPRFVNVQKYKPQIEKKVADVTGRQFALNGPINLSLFPWVGVRLSDVHLGNPPGFKEKDFVSVKSFEVRVKVLPLLSKEVEVSKFVLVEPRIVLEKLKNGKKNWEGLGTPAPKSEKKAEKKEVTKKKPEKALPIKSLTVGEFTIKKASLLYLDNATKTRKEISDLNLSLKNVSLDKPIKIIFSALFNGKPVSLNGKLGPIGSVPPKGSVPVNLELKAFDELDATLKGKLSDLTRNARFQVAFEARPFSLKEILKQLGEGASIETSDPKALEKIALKFKLSGGSNSVNLSDGLLQIDDSKLVFSLSARRLTHPDIAFNFDLDQIDADRYLPPKKAKGKKEKPTTVASSTKSSGAKSKPADYGALRKLKVNGIIKAGKIKVSGAKMHDLVIKVKGANGIFHIDPMMVQLYEGKINSTVTLDVRKKAPSTRARVDAQGIKVAPLLKDVMKKDFLEGTVKAEATVSTVGDNAYAIKRNLNGKGVFLFTDGAIVGFDLPGMVRNIKATFGLAKRAKEKPKTDFSELKVPFIITNGLFKTEKASMKSPVLRVVASGTANLVNEKLDFRIEPKFVATLKGQGDQKKRSGILVPVLVTGTFSSPKFAPDIKGMITQQLKEGVPKPSELKNLIPGVGKKGEKGKKKASSIEEKSKGLLKSLPFGK